jgi:flagellar basal-body rod protein FlgF
MDPLTISAASGLRSRMESLDMLANNLANAATAGYKKDSESYGLYMSAAALDDGADADPVTATLPVIERRWTDYSSGVLETTGSPLDVAISGDGFLGVNGDGGTLYTRDGRFRVASNGLLETLDGYPVRSTAGGAIQVASNDPVQIAADGTVTQKGQALGKLEVVRFADRSNLEKAGASYYRSAETPAAAAGVEILQGKIEGSNVNSAESAVRLVNVMRQFEVLTKAVMVNAEMNRKATEEVARVGS